MPDTREKLIELLKDADEFARYYREIEANGLVTKEDPYAIAADYLIANGVTVQELDSERIIRCKDCVYYRPAEDWNRNKYDACYLKPDVCILQRKPTDFCSYAEQKLPEPPKGD